MQGMKLALLQVRPTDLQVKMTPVTHETHLLILAVYVHSPDSMDLAKCISCPGLSFWILCIYFSLYGFATAKASSSDHLPPKQEICYFSSKGYLVEQDYGVCRERFQCSEPALVLHSSCQLLYHPWIRHTTLIQPSSTLRAGRQCDSEI